MLTGMKKIPAFLVNAAFMCMGVISYAIFVDLSQGENARFDYRHLGNLSIIISSLIIGYAANRIWRSDDRDEAASNLFKMYFAIIFVNSIIITLQVLDPGLRAMIEGIIAESSRTDYLEGIRYRGLASAGGATLSIATAISTVTAIHFAKIKEINWSTAIAIGMINTFAMIFIGRTGFLVLMAYLLYDTITNVKKIKLIASLFISPIFIWIFYTLVESAVNVNIINIENYRHAFGILLDINEYGLTGAAENEGTIPNLLSFFAFPESIWNLIFGIGNFSGGYLWGYPGDPGLMKVLTLVGLPATIILYLFIIFLTTKLANASIKYKNLILFIGLILIVLEIKEPFLFKGSSAKLFWIVAGIYLSQKNFSKNVFSKLKDNHLKNAPA